PGQLASAALTARPAGSITSLPPPIHGSVGHPMMLGSLRLTVASVDVAAAPPSGFTVRTGERLVAADVRYRDVGSGPTIVSPYDWAVTSPSGSVYGAVQDASADGLPQRQLG